MGKLLAMIVLAGCGGAPLLANAPHPNNAAVAGVAAAAAAAMTIADPNGTTFKRETLTPDQQKEVDSHATVPTDVLDRLDTPAKPGVKPKQATPPSAPDPDDGQPLPSGPGDHPNPLAPAP
jgi:hypothetical protein